MIECTHCLCEIEKGEDHARSCPYYGHESPRSPGCLNVPSELDVAEDKIQELETLITVLRADIRELYSMRGEDELTAKYCNAILTATADI